MLEAKEHLGRLSLGRCGLERLVLDCIDQPVTYPR